jgi:hypothetical protein
MAMYPDVRYFYSCGPDNYSSIISAKSTGLSVILNMNEVYFVKDYELSFESRVRILYFYKELRNIYLEV